MTRQPRPPLGVPVDVLAGALALPRTTLVAALLDALPVLQRHAPVRLHRDPTVTSGARVRALLTPPQADALLVHLRDRANPGDPLRDRVLRVRVALFNAWRSRRQLDSFCEALMAPARDEALAAA